MEFCKQMLRCSRCEQAAVAAQVVRGHRVPFCARHLPREARAVMDFIGGFVADARHTPAMILEAEPRRQ